MQKFHYRGIKDNKKQIKGIIEAETKEEAVEALLNQDIVVLDIKPQGFNLGVLMEINIGGVPSKDKMFFVRQLAFMVGAGVPLAQSLELTTDQITNLGFKKAMMKLTKDVEAGIPLSQALEKKEGIFDKVVTNLIKAGEESGKLEMILNRIADDMEKKEDFKNKLKGALIYPVVVIIAIIAIVILLMMFMVPQMSKLYADQGATLPLATQIVINISDFLTKGNGGILIFGFVLIMLISFIYYRHTPSGRLVTDRLSLRIPLFGEVLRKANAAEFANTLSMLLNAGIPILDALLLVSESTENVYIKNQIMDARMKVEKGIPLSLPILNSDAFPTMLGYMIRVGEETGKIDEILLKVGSQYSKEVEFFTNNINKLIEPIILVMMGLVVGGLAIAVYLPIMNLGSIIAGGS